MTRLKSACRIPLALLSMAALGAHAATISGRVVGPDGKGVAQAVVFVQSPALPDAGSATRTAEMSQINRTFVPAVLPVAVGTRVSFPNRDPIQHHVYSFSRTKSFELPLYRGESAPPVLFDKPGVVKIGCNIHDWMAAIILVLPTSHFAMTDDDGRYALPALPAGDYTLAAWHARSREKTGTVTQPVQIANLHQVVDFKMALDDPRTRPAQHGVRPKP